MTTETCRVFVSDPRVSPRFKLPDPLIIGDEIKIEPNPNASLKMSKSYNVQLKETSVETGDASCVFYPDSGRDKINPPTRKI